MLSSSVIKNVSVASHYYNEQDNYYTQEQGLEKSEWWGKGATKLGLQGQVGLNEFNDLLRGKTTQGEQLGKVIDGQLQHRPGWDLTFSAPKSVSLVALVGNDHRLLEAHRHAVSVAMSEIEKSCGQARYQTSEGMSFQNTKNLVAALYHHDLSRAQDPQLHTHCVVMNMTERQDGKWRSLASSLGGYKESAQNEINGFIERVRHHNRFFSKVYESELAFRVKELGYSITTDTKSGIFEIEGVSAKTIEHFSKRREAIEKQLDEKGFSGGKAAAIATLDSRDEKTCVDRRELQQLWIDDATKLNCNLSQIISNAISKDKVQPTIQSVDIDHKEIILLAAKEISRFKTILALDEVVTKALSFSIGNKNNIGYLLNTAKSLVDTGELISLPDQRGKARFILHETLADEKVIFDLVATNNSKFKNPLIAKNDLISDSSSTYQSILETIFNNERINILDVKNNGNDLFGLIAKNINTHKIPALMITPSQIAKKTYDTRHHLPKRNIFEKISSYIKDTETKHCSVNEFISNIEKDSSHSPRIVVVEQANLLSTYQQARLFEWCYKRNSKLVLSGSSNAILSRQRGVSLLELKKKGITTVSMLEKEGLKNNHTPSSNNQIIQIENNSARSDAMVEQYFKIKSEATSIPWLIVSNRSQVNTLNNEAHDKLKSFQPNIKSSKFNVLLPVHIERGKEKVATTYSSNQIVRFNDNYPSLNIRRGEYLKISKNSKVSNRVVLIKQDGSHVIWRPDKVACSPGKVELFNQHQKEFSHGEIIIATRGYKPLNMVKGERFTINAIKNNHIKLRNSDNKIVQLDLSKPHLSHIDYGYAETLHSVAHETNPILICAYQSLSSVVNKRLVEQIHQQSNQSIIYTDNVERFNLKTETMAGDRHTATTDYHAAKQEKQAVHALFKFLEKQVNSDELNVTSLEAIEYAINHVTERESGFTHKDLLKTALQYRLGTVTTDELTHSTRLLEKSGFLLRGTKSDGTLWTTLEEVKLEREIITLCNQNKGMGIAVSNEDSIIRECERSALKLEQTLAVKDILQSKDRIIAVQGYAGTGKTTMLMTVKRILNKVNASTNSSYEILGLAPTHTAVRELDKRGIPSTTIDHFINHIKNETMSGSQTKWQNKIIVVDETSMVSNAKLVELLTLFQKLECKRIILTGDRRQLLSIESGKAFELAQTQLETSELKVISRQSENAYELKQSVDQTIKYDFKAAIYALNDAVIENPLPFNEKPNIENKIQNRDARIATLVKDYFSFAKEERDNIQVITPGHDDRLLTNLKIRQGLKMEGSLPNIPNQHFTILTNKSMTKVEQSHITNLKIGDVLRFNTRDSNHIRSGDYLTIVDKKPGDRMLILRSSTGNNILWQIPTYDTKRLQHIEVFQKTTRDLQVGDLIRWTRSDKTNDLLSTEPARVITIHGDKTTVLLSNNHTLTFSKNDPKFQHWDYGYASTVYAAQGKTKGIVLAHLESYRDNLTTQPSFLVALTRAVNVFRLYTDDKNKLIETITRNHGSKLSALDIIGKFPTKKDAQNKVTTTTLDKEVAGKKPSNIPQVKPHIYSRTAINLIKQGLNKEAGKIAVELLGSPKEKGSNYLKFGRNQGSLVVTTKGEKQGWFNDFETNIGGRDMLKFIQIHGNLSRNEALKMGANRVGLIDLDTPVSPLKSIKNTTKTSEVHQDQQTSYTKKRIQFAQKIAQESQPLQGTLAEKYLKDFRGITLENDPKDIRFHSSIYAAKNKQSLPALIAIARNVKGEIQAVEAIYLNPKTGNKADVPLSKQTIGLKKGALVSLHQSAELNPTTLIAEGVVTGLSLAKALPEANVVITLGKHMYASIEPKQISDKVIFCLDNDGQNFKKDTLILQASNRLIEAKKAVDFMVPNGLNVKKQDYNDILVHKGIEAIQKDFKCAISFNNFYKNNNPSALMTQTSLSEIAKNIDTSKADLEKNRIEIYRSLTNNSPELIKSKTPTFDRER